MYALSGSFGQAEVAWVIIKLLCGYKTCYVILMSLHHYDNLIFEIPHDPTFA